jgi:ArsR family transcriptional regulator, arsenate/arsenite/antimonite-responsive transcriptional repressor
MPAETPDRTDLIFKALASRPRREILALLATSGAGSAGCCSADEVCACEFAEKLGLGAPTVSHHMKALTEAGLVTSSKRGLWVYYKLVPGAFEPMLEQARLFASTEG